MNKKVELGIFDYLLVMTSCSISLLALGESLSRHSLSVFLAIASIVSIFIGFLISRSRFVSKVKDWDGYIWCALAIAATFLARPLNQLLPEEGFPFVLFAGSWLSWLVILCGVASWRDQTLLFLNLPCLSAFALVGTFDTFAPATLLFFVFLVSSSLLYARIHQRSMIKRAKQAGQEDPRLLHRDSWRWMAGPEWALASAGIIVVFSLVFGPILKFTLEPVAGSVKVALPPAPPTPATNANASSNSEMMVGRGPVFLDNSVILKVRMDHPGYLRSSIYTVYGGNGWSRLRGVSELAGLDALSPKVLDSSDTWVTGFTGPPPMEPIASPIEKVLTIAAAGDDNAAIMAPGPITRAKVPGATSLVFTAQGTVFRRGEFRNSKSVDIAYLEPNPGVTPGPATFPEAVKPIEKYFLDTGTAPPTVIEFAREAAKGAPNDYAKASQIAAAIAKTATYSLKAPPLVSSKDAVAQFLFETRKGYCDLYATAMTVCARAVGLPARFVTGFIVNKPEPDANGFYDIHSRDAHAWSEVFLKGYGWVKFDATENTNSEEGGSQNKGGDWLHSPAAATTAGVGLLLLAGLAVYLWNAKGPVSASRFLAALGFKSSLPTRAHASRLHQEFDRALRRHTGTVRRFSQTTREYVEATRERLGTVYPEAVTVVGALEAACFGPQEPSKLELADISARLKSIRRTKRQRVRP